jgi:hypothetical protein
MSIQLVTEFARELPPRLRDDVIGYARSVQAALPEILRDAEVADTGSLGDQLVLIAGVRKLYAVCTSAFWTLDNSLAGLRQADVHQVRLGGMFISRGSRDWQQLRDAVVAIEVLLADQRLLPLVHLTSYAEIARELTHER